MRSWEKKDITDILIKHHGELRKASVEEKKGDDTFMEGDRLDDDCIVIEEFLESAFGIEWDGLRFLGIVYRGKKLPSKS